MTLSRRSFGIGAAALGVLASVWFFHESYPPTPYDDLLHQIRDRRPAALLGKAAARALPGFTVASLAARLRQPGFALQQRARSDAAASRLTEVDGWLVPETVTLYSTLAAQF